MTREILINQLFAGSYLEESGNIGHEIINLFDADDDKHYVYVTPSGVVKENHDVEAIFFVRNIAARRTVEVIAVATDLERVSPERAASIEYAGVALKRIFRGNTYHGSEELDSPSITFCAGKVMTPCGERPLVLTLDSDSQEANAIQLDTPKKVLVPQGLRSYYAEGEKAYAQLLQLINNNKLWDSSREQALLVPRDL